MVDINHSATVLLVRTMVDINHSATVDAANIVLVWHLKENDLW